MMLYHLQGKIDWNCFKAQKAKSQEDVSTRQNDQSYVNTVHTFTKQLRQSQQMINKFLNEHEGIVLSDVLSM